MARFRRQPLAVDSAEYLRVYNRTTNVLTVGVDGRQWLLQPGWGSLPSVAIPYARRQHPRLGTFGQHGSGGESLIAVEGHDPPEWFRPLAPGREHLGRERLDRTSVDAEGQTLALPEGWVTEALPPQRSYSEFGAPYQTLTGGDAGHVKYEDDNAGLNAPAFMAPFAEGGGDDGGSDGD